MGAGTGVCTRLMSTLMTGSVSRMVTFLSPVLMVRLVEWSNLSMNITLGGDKEFHWCYEGDCGPDHWGDHFEVDIRIP